MPFDPLLFIAPWWFVLILIAMMLFFFFFFFFSRWSADDLQANPLGASPATGVTPKAEE